MLQYSMETGGQYAILLLVACIVGGGVTGAVLRSWAIDRRISSLEFAVAELQGTLTREVKIRAAHSRTPGSKIEREAAELLKASQAAQTPMAQPPLEFWKR